MMSILLIKTSSRAISGTLSSDFTFHHFKACPARFRRLFFGGSTSRDNLFDKSAAGARIQSWHLSPAIPPPPPYFVRSRMCCSVHRSTPHLPHLRIFWRYKTFRCRFFPESLRACVCIAFRSLPSIEGVNRKRFFVRKIFVG